MDADPDFTQLCRDMSYVEKYINTLIDKEKIPDVVLCKSEKLAAYASIILQKKNYKIPEDIEILCVGDSEICSLVKPQLTSVDIKSKEICNTVINVLIGKINKKTVPVISIINVELLKESPHCELSFYKMNFYSLNSTFTKKPLSVLSIPITVPLFDFILSGNL